MEHCPDECRRRAKRAAHREQCAAPFEVARPGATRRVSSKPLGIGNDNVVTTAWVHTSRSTDQTAPISIGLPMIPDRDNDSSRPIEKHQMIKFVQFLSKFFLVIEITPQAATVLRHCNVRGWNRISAEHWHRHRSPVPARYRRERSLLLHPVPCG